MYHAGFDKGFHTRFSVPVDNGDVCVNIVLFARSIIGNHCDVSAFAFVIINVSEVKPFRSLSSGEHKPHLTLGCGNGIIEGITFISYRKGHIGAFTRGKHQTGCGRFHLQQAGVWIDNNLVTAASCEQ